MQPVNIRPYDPQTDERAFLRLWNQVIEAGVSYPGERPLSETELEEMLAQQSAVRCAFADGALVGLYILHPNNIGRCGHIANASYAVDERFRGRGIGRELVLHSLGEAQRCGYRGLQFNAVVAANGRAVALYKKLGFAVVGRVPEGFRLPDGTFSDTLIFYKAV